MSTKPTEKTVATATVEQISSDGRPAPPLGRVLINRKQRRQKVPLCERTILDMEKRGEFPRRFLIGRNVVVWDLHEVEAWIERQRVISAQASPPGSKKTE
ncbi:transcriptional regulator, AlpA family [Massilia sp. PDC64]|nr:AlpA family phage regulatory protein [Massilia sp. PDC64]SDF79121.1 transcriptional regulator, AlpA family [Massilia sp. PDC64]